MYKGCVINPFADVNLTGISAHSALNSMLSLASLR